MRSDGIGRALLAAIAVFGCVEVRGQQYVGSEVCQACHDAIATAFAKDAHRVVETAKKFNRVGQACEACHGAGGKHAESALPADIVNPAKRGLDRTCLQCHLNQPTHAGRIQGGHAKGQVACVGCHAVHASAPPAAQAKSRQCSGCHLSAWAEFQKPHAHKVALGAMSCLDCHNPHGEFRAQQVRSFAANEPGCLRCHADKRGPFAFEHAPMRLAGCGACHEAHGSANPRMLTRHEVRFVCLECHANTGAGASLGGVPPSFHDLRSPRYQNCTVCHQKVHGSHVNRSLLR